MSEIFDYVKLDKDNLFRLIIISLTLSLMFLFTYVNLLNMVNNVGNINIFEVYLEFFLFILILETSRFIFMRYIAYKNGIELNIKVLYIDRFWYRSWDKLSYYFKNLKKGVPIYILALIFSIISFGAIIFASLINYSYKKIPHLYVGTQMKFEGVATHRGVSYYRYTKILFFGILFYFLMAFFMKFLANLFGLDFYSVFIFILYYIAIFTTLPIPHTSGYDLFSRNKSAWIASISILIFSLLALLVFNSLIMILVFTMLSIFVITIVVLWNKLI